MKNSIYRIGILISLSTVFFLIMSSFFVTQAGAVEKGYRDFTYGSAVSSSPTGEKPESKLWWNDGIWWGSLWSPKSGAYHIYRLDWTSQNWIDTGVAIDDRPDAKADTLWDGAHLYVASQVFTTSGVPTSGSWGRLYRFNYSPGDHSYTLDAGFPVNITRGKSETIVLEKDSLGTLWVTYTESSRVMVNHSIGGDDRVWGEPYPLPFTDAQNLKGDDISSIISYNGKIGIMWSNQNTRIMYFAIHSDGDSNDKNWKTVSVYNPGGSAADDHMNLKSIQTDSAGNVFVVAKTSFSKSTQPLIVLFVCKGSGCELPTNWSAYTIYTVQENHTRAILLIDTDHRKLHIFATLEGTSKVINHKVSDIDRIQFSAGDGEIFIQSSLDKEVNNSTSTKQNVNSSTGIVVLSSDDTTFTYLHNVLDLSGTTLTATPSRTSTATYTPTATVTPTATPTPSPTALPTNTEPAVQPQEPTYPPATPNPPPPGSISYLPVLDNFKFP